MSAQNSSDTRLVTKLREHDLAGFVPDMRPDEWRAFFDDVAERGVVNPLTILKDGLILDGRHRYRAARELGLARVPVRTVSLNSASAEEYMIKAALLRRHLSDDQRAVLARKWQKRESEKAQSEAGKRARAVQLGDLDTVSKSPERNTRLEAVRLYAVPERKVRYAAEIERKAPELLPAIERGEMTFLDAKKQLRRVNRDERNRAIVANNKPLDGAGKPNVIYADPPWRYEHVETDSRAIENQYPTLSLEEICAQPVGENAADDCVLFLWATNPKLAEATKVIEAWGFTYRTNVVWVKDRPGMGYYARQRHELLLIAVRGELPAPAENVRPDSVQEYPRGQHSQKPDPFYSIIESMYPQFYEAGLCTELFCREPRKGWKTWGNQV